ncbi:MAG: NUDIX domain-containing protein [Patescibacteria group bacterium]|jgi:mutator protein MutT
MKAGKDFIGVGCGALIVNDKGETLLMKRAAKSKNEVGYWTKPGGTIEFGETVAEAIKREVKEELGIEVELTDFINYTDHIIAEEEQHWIAINYAARIIRGKPRIMEPEKAEEIRWFPLDELPDKISQTTIEPAEVYLDKHKGT